MRCSFWVIVGLFLLSACPAVQAQVAGGSSQQTGQASPGQPAGLNPLQQKMMEGILAAWEADAKNLQSLYVQFAIEETDPIFKSKTKTMGEAKVLKMPTGQYSLKLEIFNLDRQGQIDRNSVKEKYVYAGSWFYTFDYSNRIITFRKIDDPRMKPDDGPLAFLMGMKADDARKRFTMSVIQDDPQTIWIRLKPLTAQDQRYFSLLQVGIAKAARPNSPKDFPLRIMWREPGGKELSWEFTSVVRNNLAQVTVADFTIENEKRQGWQVREAQAMGVSTPNTSPGVPTSGNGVPRK